MYRSRTRPGDVKRVFQPDTLAPGQRPGGFSSYNRAYTKQRHVCNDQRCLRNWQVDGGERTQVSNAVVGHL